mmetsp:Transcript_104916/g.146282  ORF Transcript_104916/g.146282 Transcript_104916/m.146282 type:complete len:303 (-) Transcript_104916:53-961(-)
MSSGRLLKSPEPYPVGSRILGAGQNAGRATRRLQGDRPLRNLRISGRIQKNPHCFSCICIRQADSIVGVHRTDFHPRRSRLSQTICPVEVEVVQRYPCSDFRMILEPLAYLSGTTLAPGINCIHLLNLRPRMKYRCAVTDVWNVLALQDGIDRRLQIVTTPPLRRQDDGRPGLLHNRAKATHSLCREVTFLHMTLGWQRDAVHHNHVNGTSRQNYPVHVQEDDPRFLRWRQGRSGKVVFHGRCLSCLVLDRIRRWQEVVKPAECIIDRCGCDFGLFAGSLVGAHGPKRNQPLSAIRRLAPQR